jgi:hypothetical protein
LSKDITGFFQNSTALFEHTNERSQNTKKMQIQQLFLKARNESGTLQF